MVDAVLFDLGNTLVRYMERAEFPGILEQAIAGVQDYLRQEGLLRISSDAIWQGVDRENHESPDYRVRPLKGRLARIFQLDESARSDDLLMAMCRRFMGPIFARGHLYDDTLPVLEGLRVKGLKTAIISNTPWGSPGKLWRKEIARLGLRDRVDIDVFCDDVGWRKPARQIFEHTMERLGVEPQQCLFVGDDPRWDLVGPRAVGIEALLIDRRGAMTDVGEDPIRNLYQLGDRLGLL